MDAALRLVSKGGYLGASTRDIAAAAGVAEVTLFRHFGSKERLFAAMLQRYAFANRLRELVREIECLPVEEALFRVGVNFLQTLKEREALVRITLSEASRYPKAVRAMHERLMSNTVETLGRHLADRVRAGELGRVATRFAAQAFLDALFAHFVAGVILAGQRRDARADRMTSRAFVKLLLDGMRAGRRAAARPMKGRRSAARAAKRKTGLQDAVRKAGRVEEERTAEEADNGAR